jgi:hypothetical protein
MKQTAEGSVLLVFHGHTSNSRNLDIIELSVKCHVAISAFLHILLTNYWR